MSNNQSTTANTSRPQQLFIIMSIGLIITGCVLVPWPIHFDNLTTAIWNALTTSLPSVMFVTVCWWYSWINRAISSSPAHIAANPKVSGVSSPTHIAANPKVSGVSPSNSDTTLVGSEQTESTLVGSQTESKSWSKFTSTVSPFSLDIPNEPYARQRCIDRLPAPVTGVLFAGTDRAPRFTHSSPSLLPGEVQTAGAKIEITEAVHALAHLKNVVDIEEWEALGLSCSCEVVRGEYFYFSSEQGGKYVEEMWNKEVVTVKSAWLGFSPAVQACFWKLLDNAPKAVSFIYSPTPPEPPNEDDFDPLATTMPSPAHFKHPKGATFMKPSMKQAPGKHTDTLASA